VNKSKATYISNLLAREIIGEAMTFGELLKFQRGKTGMGQRELCRKSKSMSALSKTISASYYNQIEKDHDKIIVSKIGSDPLWAIGYALKIDPNSLFALTRRIENIPEFKIRDCKFGDLPSFIRSRREELGLTSRSAEDLIMNKVSGEILSNELTISSEYLNQIENNKCNIPKIEGDKFWALGVGYDIDTLLFYVLSRGLDRKLLKYSERKKLFPESLEHGMSFETSQSENEKFIFLEGQKAEVEFFRYKRNSKVAQLRKELDRYACKICGFKIKYNEKYVIECHHLLPLGLGERETRIDDLISVCPTCHQIFHLSTPPLSPDEVQHLRNNGQQAAADGQTAAP
jgi:transcriptional regulator with XRE-family HTH domain